MLLSFSSSFLKSMLHFKLKWHTVYWKDIKGPKVWYYIYSNRCLQQCSLDFICIFSHTQKNYNVKSNWATFPNKIKKVKTWEVAELTMCLTSWSNMLDSRFVSGFWVIQLHLCRCGQMVLLVCWLWALLKQLLHCKKLGELCCSVMYMSLEIMSRLDFFFNSSICLQIILSET